MRLWQTFKSMAHKCGWYGWKGVRVVAAWDTPQQAQNLPGSAAHRVPNPGYTSGLC